MYHVILLVPLACIATLHADDLPSSIALEAEIKKSMNERGVQPFTLRLVAKDKEVVVLTDGFSPKVSQEGKVWTILFTPTDRKDDKGRTIVQPPTRYGLVKLQPNEVALMHVPYSPTIREAIKEAADGNGEIRVIYEVTQTWAKRLGATPCKVSSMAAK
ncbi:MAG: hypothetical protein U0744_09920 [Gemmataceae bacterium]